MITMLLGILNSKADGQERSWYDLLPADTINFNFKDFDEKTVFKIDAYINDCGEFGGHWEHLSFHQLDSKVIGVLKCNSVISEDASCEYTIFPFCGDTISVNAENEKLILQFLKDFGTVGLKKQVAPGQPEVFTISNAPTSFDVTINSRVYTRNDPGGRWQGFVNLRTTLFKKQ